METAEKNNKTALDEARHADRENQITDPSQTKQAPKEPIIDFSGDSLYFFAFIVAVAKDLSDYISNLLPIPLLGMLITLMAFCLLALLIFLASPGDFFRNFGILFGGTTIDMIPFLNLLPALTAVVVYIYVKKIVERSLKNKGIGAKIITKHAAGAKS